MSVDFSITMPDLAATESEITVLAWRVGVGESVQRGQTLLEVETDKATMEVEAVVSGVLKEVLAQPDDRVEVGQVIAVVETDDRTPSMKSVSEDAAQLAAGDAAATETPTEPPATAAKPARSGLFARNRAKRTDGAKLPERSEECRGESDPVLRVSPAHRRAAERLQHSQQTVPHFYLQTSTSAENLVARRSARSGMKTAWDAFFVYAAARALERHDRMAYRYEDGRLVRQPSDAIGVAVDVDGDLFVVPIADPGSQTPEHISGRLHELVDRLRAGDPDVRRIQPAWMTVSNLGVCGVESFAAIVNPPESAVLAVGRVAPAPVVRENEVVIEHRVNLTLAIDHRIVNGRYAAGFLNAIVQELETLDKDLP
jgi:pyruvate dehydrogenase E2 component (dihydrolipoamide acetyltransferase)